MVMPSDELVSSGENDGPQDVNICAVCRNTYHASDTTCTTPCGHVFHFRCLAQWLTYSRRCPLCRQTITTDEPSILNSSTDADSASTTDNSEIGSVDIEISGVDDLGSGSFRNMVGRLFELPDRRLDLYVSHQPPPIAAPPPPIMPPPTPDNVIQSLKAGNVYEVENMLSHNRSLISSLDADGDTLLHLAVLAQHDYMVEYLHTTAGIPANTTNNARMTPLHYAVTVGSARMVCLLTDLGSYVDAADACGRTPLMYATTNHAKQLVDLLLLKGANVNTTDLLGDTALHYASRSGYFDGVKALVRCGCTRMNAANCLGETALHLACRSGSKACIRFLDISGANPTNKTKTGKLPNDYLATV